MKTFWAVVYPVIVILALWAGIVTQFVWKMIYFPEPILPVIIELIFITSVSGSAIWMTIRR